MRLLLGRRPILLVDEHAESLTAHARSVGWLNTQPHAIPGIGSPDPEALERVRINDKRIVRQHGDQAFGERQRMADAVRFAKANGVDEGHRKGYVEGFGWGAWCGGIAGIVLTPLAYMAIAWARLRFGF